MRCSYPIPAALSLTLGIRVPVHQLPTAFLVAEDFGHADSHRHNLARLRRHVHSRVLVARPKSEIAAGSALQHLEPVLALWREETRVLFVAFGDRLRALRGIAAR